MQKIITLDLGGVNCYLIENTGKFILVDTGGHMFMDKIFTDRCDDLEKKLKDNGINKENLELLILTHGDDDHVHNAKFIRDTFNCKIAMNKNDVDMVIKQNPECYKENSKYSSILFKIVFKIMAKKIDKLMNKVYGEFKPFEPDILLEEGDNLEKYGFDGTIYYTPGHTVGSICILDNLGNLLCGDLFANNKKPTLAPNASDFKMLKSSANMVLQKKVKMVYPGHGVPYKINVDN